MCYRFVMEIKQIGINHLLKQRRMHWLNNVDNIKITRNSFHMVLISQI